MSGGVGDGSVTLRLRLVGPEALRGVPATIEIACEEDGNRFFLCRCIAPLGEDLACVVPAPPLTGLQLWVGVCVPSTARRQGPSAMELGWGSFTDGELVQERLCVDTDMKWGIMAPNQRTAVIDVTISPKGGMWPEIAASATSPPPTEVGHKSGTASVDFLGRHHVQVGHVVGSLLHADGGAPDVALAQRLYAAWRSTAANGARHPREAEITSELLRTEALVTTRPRIDAAFAALAAAAPRATSEVDVDVYSPIAALVTALVADHGADALVAATASSARSDG